ncbi:unnamed protein product, partial [Oppiella nova]
MFVSTQVFKHLRQCSQTILRRTGSPLSAAYRRQLSCCTQAAPLNEDTLAVQSQLPAPLTQLTTDEEAMRDIVRRLADEKVRPLVRQMDESAVMDQSVIDALFANGLMSVNIDTAYGGTGGNTFSLMVVIEELAKACASVSAFVGIHSTLAVQTLISFGTDDQKRRYLPVLAQRSAGSFCISEPNAGSDAFALKTTATREGDHWVINGAKSWITNAKEAQVFVVFANADPRAGHRGITCFIVDRHTPGLTVERPENKLGIRCSSTCPVTLDGVRVPECNVVGQVGQGYKYAIQTLNVGRIGIAAQMLGLAEGCFQEAVRYTFDRKQFGRRIFDFQALQHQISRAATEIESARLLVYNSARLRDAGMPFVKEASMAKYYASEVATRTTSKAVEWLGGVGFTK